MYIFSFDGEQLTYMLVGGANLLAENRAEVDALNVFPVPDGDTGTNMYLTVLSGVKEARQVTSGSIGDVAAAMARGCLLGARGNSGVILSQVFGGFAAALRGKETAGAADIAVAFARGSEAAYKAVSNPVEGTILSVCRKAAEACARAVTRSNDPVRLILLAHRSAEKALVETPSELPVLREAGVVDAGGKGLVVILEGIIRALRDAASQHNGELFNLAASQHKEFAAKRARDFTAEMEFTYCTEFLLTGKHIPLDTLRAELAPYGDCLLVVGDDRTAKVHIHSNHPGLVLECGLKYGALQRVQISNMEEQHRDLSLPAAGGESKPAGVVAVGAGEGIATILESTGVEVVVEGGQTMNPSAEDLVDAVNCVNAESVIILPNNNNILMAARQAAMLAGKEVLVVPSVSVPQGIAAMLAFNPYDTAGDNRDRMESALGSVKTGEVTMAVRDAVNGDLPVRKGEYIGLADNKLLAAGGTLDELVMGLLGKMADDDSSLVTFYFGAGLTGAEARAVTGLVRDTYPDLDVEEHYGGQPLYQFIISVE